MIVKVQLLVESNMPQYPKGSRMLVYNQSRSVQYEQAAQADIVEKMKGRPKAFFHAEKIEPDNPKSKISIKEEAPWQEW